MYGESLPKTLFRLMWGSFMIMAGVKHFTSPEFFMPMMPTWIPLHLHEACVLASGFFEILGGIGIVLPHPKIRKATAIGFISLLIAVSPVHIHMMVNDVPFNGIPVPLWGHVLRIVFQIVMICLMAWLYTSTTKVKSVKQE